MPFLDNNDMTTEEKQLALKHDPKLLNADHVPQEVKKDDDKDDGEKEVKKIEYGILGKIVRFTRKQVDQIKREATNPLDSNSWVSTFEALSAFFHQIVHRSRQQFYADDISLLSPPDFLTSINCRGSRLPDLPPMYFPNALLIPHGTISSETLANAPLWEVASKWHALSKDDRPNSDDIRKLLWWICAQPNKRVIKSGFRFGSGAFMTSQWSKFDCYETMKLAGNRPLLVSPPFSVGSVADGLAYFLPSETQGLGVDTSEDVDVRLSLLEPVWDILERNDDYRRIRSIV
ncbi:hypothetical protein GEMRC1_004351 [Eukaryota sp. GEM-RC1]